MNKYNSHYVKNLLLPCLFFSVITGIISAILITLFKLGAELVINLSGLIYHSARNTPIWLPCLLLGAIAVGFAANLILGFSKTCRGGGIPTSIAAIRGITSFKWLSSIFLLPVSALLTFLAGLPLGTEGPCVQMGTAIGDGVVQLFGRKKHIGWRRYIMTGGASAGFALATGAPITAILFSMEELHKRFSPLLFSVASISVVICQITSQILADLGIVKLGLFHIGTLPTIPLKLLFIPVAIGVLCGGCSIIFTRAYNRIDKMMRITFESISINIKFPIIFVCIALVGFFISKILGTGHSLIENLFETQTVWYTLIIIFLIRAVFMMVANTSGITGGIFLPTLAFGSIIGTLCAKAFIAIDLIGNEHYILMIILGMTAFLGATSRIPLTACAFAIEALSGINNILAIIIAVTCAFLTVELSGVDDFTDTVIETKAKAIHKGKKSYQINVPLTVYKNAFVIDKDLSDILWPVSCVVLSIERGPNSKEKTTIAEGDVLTVHYKTYDPIATAQEFEILVGDQSEDIDKIMRPDKTN